MYRKAIKKRSGEKLKENSYSIGEISGRHQSILSVTVNRKNFHGNRLTKEVVYYVVPKKGAKTWNRNTQRNRFIQKGQF